MTLQNDMTHIAACNVETVCISICLLYVACQLPLRFVQCKQLHPGRHAGVALPAANMQSQLGALRLKLEGREKSKLSPLPPCPCRAGTAHARGLVATHAAVPAATSPATLASPASLGAIPATLMLTACAAARGQAGRASAAATPLCGACGCTAGHPAWPSPPAHRLQPVHVFLQCRCSSHEGAAGSQGGGDAGGFGAGGQRAGCRLPGSSHALQESAHLRPGSGQAGRGDMLPWLPPA